MVIKMSAFDCLEIGITLLHTTLVIWSLVIIVEHASSITSIVIVITSMAHVSSSHSTTLTSAITSHAKVTSVTTTIHLLHTTSLVVLLHFAYLLLLGFQGNGHLFWGHWIIRFSELMFTVCKMTPFSQSAIIVLLPMSAHLSFVFLIDLVLHLLLGHLHTATSTTHTSHHVVIELILLIVPLVKLTLALRS